MKEKRRKKRGKQKKRTEGEEKRHLISIARDRKELTMDGWT